MRRLDGFIGGGDSLDAVKLICKALPRITEFKGEWCSPSGFLHVAEELQKHGAMQRLSLRFLPQFEKDDEDTNNVLRSAFVQILERNNKLQYLKVELEADPHEEGEFYEDCGSDYYDTDDEDLVVPICSDENARAWLGAIRAGLEKNTCITELMVSGTDELQVLHDRFYIMEPKIVYFVNLNRAGRGAVRCAKPAEMIELILKVNECNLLGTKHFVGEGMIGSELYQQSLVFDLLLESTEKWCIAAADCVMAGAASIS
jgi:hypothetical protein